MMALKVDNTDDVNPLLGFTRHATMPQCQPKALQKVYKFVTVDIVINIHCFVT